MDSEILAKERAHHRRFRAIYRIGLFLVLGGASLGLIFAAFNSSARSGWVMLIGISAIAAGVTAMSIRMDRKVSSELASNGPWSFGQVYSAAKPRQIWNSMGEVLVKYGTNLDRLTETTALAQRPGSFLYRRGHHLLDVRESADHPGWMVISVMAAPDLPTTVTDFGRGQGINTELLAAVPGYRTPVSLSETVDD